MHPIHFPPDSALDVSTLRALVHCDSHVWGQAISADLDSLAAGFAEHVVEVVGLLLGAHKGAETAPDQLQERHCQPPNTPHSQKPSFRITPQESKKHVEWLGQLISWLYDASSDT
eukprot:3560825-Rhodomonas_salina.3